MVKGKKYRGAQITFRIFFLFVAEYEFAKKNYIAKIGILFECQEEGGDVREYRSILCGLWEVYLRLT